jgi:parallel beta-helix repeat protein
VSAEGNSAGDGLTEQTPFNTIQKGVDQLSAGDTLFVMDGRYHNYGYETGVKDNIPLFWLLESSNNGTEDNPIVIRNMPGHHPILEIDGGSVVFFQKKEHIVFDGFILRGNADKITLEEALRERPLNHPSLPYYGNIGIHATECHHLTIKNCIVFDFCGCGIWVTNSDYLTVENNMVFDNTFYAKAANCALEIHNPKSIDENEEVKISIRGNVVFGNENKVPFYWPGGWPIGPEGFGSEEFTDIIDGHGILLVNLATYDDLWTHGRILVEDNLSFNNGFNGIKSTRLNRVDIKNNIVYKNGTTAIVKNEIWGALGIYFQNGDDIKVSQNIVWGVGNPSSGIYSGDNTNDVIDNNTVYNCGVKGDDTNTYTSDPQFVNPTVDWSQADFNFNAASTGPFKSWMDKVPKTKEHFAYFYDNIYSIETGEWIDNGESTNYRWEDDSESHAINIYPNPSNGIFNFETNTSQDGILRIYSLAGVLIFDKKITTKLSEIDISNNASGIYILRLQQNNKVITEKILLN